MSTDQAEDPTPPHAKEGHSCSDPCTNNEEGVRLIGTPALVRSPPPLTATAPSPSMHASSPPVPSKPNLEAILFFFSALGSSLCYTSTLSSLVYYKATYGPKSYIYINLAVYLPLLPIAIAQARYDQDVDRMVGSANAFLCRGLMGYSLSVLALTSIPFASFSLTSEGKGGSGLMMAICLPALIIGAAGAVVQGLLYQMSSFVATNCSTSSQSLKAAVAAGIQSSALVALFVSVITGFGSSADDTESDLRRFNAIICGLECVMMGMFVVLMRYSRRVHRAMVQRDSSISLVVADAGENARGESAHGSVVGSERPDSSPDRTPLLQSRNAEEEWLVGINNDDDEQQDDPDRPIIPQSVELTYRHLFQYSSRCCLILFLTLVPSFLVASWFTKVHTDLIMLPQLLFYCRIISDFSSRLLTIYQSPSSQKQLLIMAGIRLLLVVVFFINATSILLFPHRDALSIILVCLIAFGSGYLVTGVYQLAPLALPGRYRERNVTKQAAFLNLAFSASALLGLLVSLSLDGLGL